MGTVCCSDDVVKATETSLSLEGRKLVTVIADRKTFKQKQANYNLDHAAANSQ